MNLYLQLTNALRSEGRGLEMVRVLKKVAASGVTPAEALEALNKMYVK